MESTTEGELRQVLACLSYPADKVRIVSCSQVHGLGTDLRRRLHHLPDRRYSSPTEVVAALPTASTRS